MIANAENTLALVIKASDYNESDKIITLFSPEYGKFSAHLKGVKKDRAKLKFVGEPFCFGEFLFSGRNELPVVTSCVQTDSFFELTKNLANYYCGCVVLETLSAIEQDRESNGQLFVLALKALRALCEDLINPLIVIVKFLVSLFDIMGEQLIFDRCACCGKKQAEKFYFDYSSGGLICSSCTKESAFSPEPGVIAVLRMISAFSEKELATYNAAEPLLKNSLKFLNGLMRENIKRLKSIDELVNL